MSGPLFEPNLHAALVHYPLALITLGVLIEVLAVLFWRKSSVRTAGRWMMVLGVLIAIPTVTTGLYALRQTADPAGQYGEVWQQIASTSPWSEAQWHAVEEHVSYTVAGTLLLLAGIVIWIGGTDSARRNMYLLGLVVLIASAGLIGYGSHYGGQLVYRHGTGVSVQLTQHSTGADMLAVPAIDEDLPGMPEGVSSLELHLLLAGCAIAFIAAAIGLSVRLSNVAWENRFAEERAVAAGYRPAGKMGQDSNLLSIPVIYPGTFWVFAVLLLVAAAAVGLWLFGVRSPGDLLSLLSMKQANDEWRPVLHVYYGVSMIVLAVLIGVVMRIWPRRRLLMGILCTLLVLAVVGQVWTGVLMLFDGHAGSVMRFNRLPANRPVAVMGVNPIAPTTRPAEQLPVPEGAHRLELPDPAQPKPAEPEFD